MEGRKLAMKKIKENLPILGRAQEFFRLCSSLNSQDDDEKISISEILEHKELKKELKSSQLGCRGCVIFMIHENESD